VNYRRALLLVEPEHDAAQALDLLRRVAPALESVVVATRIEAPPGDARLRALEAAAAAIAPAARVLLVPALDGEALAALCAAEEVDLLASPAPSLRGASALLEVRRRRHLPVLVARGGAPGGRVEEIACIAFGARGGDAVRAFLHEQGTRSMRVTLLGPAAPPPDEVPRLVEVAGIEASVETAGLRTPAAMRRWIDRWLPERPVDLVVFAEVAALLLLAPRLGAPALLLPPVQQRRLEVRRIDLADLADLGGAPLVRIDQTAAVGSLPPLPDQPVAFLARGHVVAVARVEGGEARLPAGLRAGALGVCRVAGTAPSVEAVEAWIELIRPGERPLVLYDALVEDEVLGLLASLAGPPVPDLLAVRLRPTESCRAIRERLRENGLPPRVLDARAVLDEGEALDVSEPLDAVRLARVARRLRRAGFPVRAIVHRGAVAPEGEGFACWSAAGLRGELPPAPAPFSREPIPGNGIELELDNARARRWLLEAIAGSTRSVHLQVYMAEDDDVGGPVEAALAGAASRGVAVRVLVDSLHGLHGSFGAVNPLLARLAQRPGVELRAVRPINELPSLVDLKQRDHRKLVVVDGRLALVGGRNLSHEYYASFDEVELNPQTTWRRVPWLDAGARVEGPAAAAVERSFLASWVEAGGAPFPIAAPPRAGSSVARVIVHRGLRDAHTLELYRELIDAARSTIHVVNGFPLLLELQHALVAALRRGVRVRTLVGHVAPLHGGVQFPGPWAAARAAATELVHARMDPLVAAGGEVHLFAVEGRPGWSPDLGSVQPHVHAKAMSVDGERCVVGSANLDITSAYWESELALVVEDPALARAFEARIDELMAGSVRVRADDPAWQAQAARRAWMRRWPGVLSI